MSAAWGSWTKVPPAVANLFQSPQVATQNFQHPFNPVTPPGFPPCSQGPREPPQSAPFRLPRPFCWAGDLGLHLSVRYPAYRHSWPLYANAPAVRASASGVDSASPCSLRRGLLQYPWCAPQSPGSAQGPGRCEAVSDQCRALQLRASALQGPCPDHPQNRPR